MFLYKDILTLLRLLLCCLFLSVRFCLTACKGKNSSTTCSGVGCGWSKIGSFLFCDLWVGVRASGTWELIPQLSTSLCEKPTSPDVVTVYCCSATLCEKDQQMFKASHTFAMFALRTAGSLTLFATENPGSFPKSATMCTQILVFGSKMVFHSSSRRSLATCRTMKETRSLTRNFSLHAF